MTSNSNTRKMGTIKFFRESVKNLKTVGTFTRSSKYLCRAMIKPVDFEKAKVIVEIGAGDGVVTKHILKAMRKDAVLLSFELNPKFCAQVRKIDDPRLIVIEDDAEKISSYLKQYGHKKAEAIISAIPFTIIPDKIALRIIQNCKDALVKDGVFTQIHYSLIPKKLYQKVFGNVKLQFTAINVPPAWVMICKNQ